MSKIRPLSVDLQKIAESELNELPSRVDDDLATFREWISKQPHLKGRTDDQHLISFLRGTKFSLERAKQKYDLFYTARGALPEIFKSRDPKLPKNLELIRQGLILPLKNTATPDSPRVFLVRLTNYDPDKYSINDVMRILNMVGDLALHLDDNFVVAGQVTLCDMSGSTFAHLGQMSPRFAKTAMVVSQDATPIRMKGIHYVNTPSGFSTVFNVFKNFLNEKNRQRVSKSKFLKRYFMLITVFFSGPSSWLQH